MSETSPAVEPQAPASPSPAPPAAAAAARGAPAPTRVDHLPPFRVLLHNDDHNDMVYVVETLLDLTPLEVRHATRIMFEAHQTGVALVLVTHRERAELYVDQFRSKGITVSMEQAR